MLKYISTLLLLVLAACTTGPANKISLETGVSWELAEYRHENLSSINYDLKFSVPDSFSKPVTAHETITFSLSNIDQHLQLDFREASELVKALIVNGVPQRIYHRNEHLIISKKALRQGANEIEIDFIAGETSLNRTENYLYTLFVPDRARTAFPLFDQPNLKATYDLTLELPESWTAIAGGAITSEVRKDGRATFQFDKSDKISSYLFSFVAGQFERVTRTIKGREMTMLHRESDKEKVERNLDAIFDLHTNSVAWIEDYTAIDYPFKKLDFALIPSFQYGGMEHVGAIQYKAESLFLEEDPSPSNLMSRASLIGHEVAHMWFGNLVTMNWFDDVWTKEVFANFIAAKMINPTFPDIDHDLSFILRHFPSAYHTDRSEGSNAIRQPLTNLNEAGSLYGNIIYNKAPIMMQQLEKLLGKETFQQGLQEYLTRFSYSNATWPELIDILDQKSPKDLKAWSQTWVNTAGRPSFDIDMSPQGSFILVENDTAGLGRTWPQSFTLTTADNLKEEQELDIGAKKIQPFKDNAATYIWNANGLGYGLFPANKELATSEWSKLSDVQKASLLINLYEQMLDQNPEITPKDFIKLSTWVMGQEKNPLLLRHITRNITSIYWTYISDRERQALSGEMEALFLNAMQQDDIPSSQRKAYFRSYQSVATSANALTWLKAVWSKEIVPDGFKMSESDFIALASNLAIRLPQGGEEILAKQLTLIENADRKRGFIFIKPSLSPDVAVRDAFFESLAKPENRAIEAWAAAALRNLNHPLRRAQAEKYIEPSLALMEEIQRTGDIFFPTRWAASALQHHRSDKAVKTIRKFLADRPDYNPQMRLKILQAADTVFRAHALLGNKQKVESYPADSQ